VQTLVERQGALVPLANEPVEAGTRVRFRLELAAAARVCVLHGTQRGRYDVLFPADGAVVVSERSLLVPGTFVFTATGERDYLVVVSTGQTEECAAAAAALTSAGPPARLGAVAGDWRVESVTELPEVMAERPR
jgi:hypothetical protein